MNEYVRKERKKRSEVSGLSVTRVSPSLLISLSLFLCGYIDWFLHR